MNFNKSTIGEVCKVGDGAHASIQRQTSGKLYLSAKNFTKNGLSLDDVSFISEDDFKKYFNPNSKALTKPQLDDLILGIIGAGLGVPYLVSNEVEEFGISSSVAIIRPNEKSIYSKFLYYWMIGPYFQKQIKSIQSGSAQGFLSLEMIRSLHVFTPKLQVQQKIASILSAYDELIKNNRQRIKLLEEVAEEIYKEWFIRLRFPGYKSCKMNNGVPTGWESGTIGELVEFKKGRNITLETVIDGNVPVVAGGLTPAYFHNKANTKSPTITISASGANAGYVNLYYEDIWASDCSYVDTLTTEFIYFFYLTLKVRQAEVTFLQKGSAQPHVYPKDIMSLKMIKPKLDIIVSFTKMIEPFFEEIKALSKKNVLLRNIRDMLLPRLISGKLSVEHLTKESEILTMTV